MPDMLEGLRYEISNNEAMDFGVDAVVFKGF